MRKHGSLTKDEEINEASWVAARGAGVGAAKWGIFSALAAAAGYAFNPIYRGTTIQFKACVTPKATEDARTIIDGVPSFLQMSGMTAGAIIDADRRLIAHEKVMRTKKKLARDAEVWRRYEEDYQLLADQSGKQEPAGPKED